MREKQDSVMTIEELAGYLKVPKSTLYKLAQEGKVPGQKVGRHWRFRKDTIDRWLDEGHVINAHPRALDNPPRRSRNRKSERGQP